MSERQLPHNEIERLHAEVPQELQQYPSWVVWNYIEVDGKQRKPPVNARTGQLASPTDPQTWSTFPQALQALQSGKFNGLGFVFSQEDPFCGTDLDHAVDADGNLEAWALPILVTLNSYTEKSPSGTGLHIITKATLPDHGRKKGNLEMYDRDRYFTLTANHFPNALQEIEPRQEAQTMLYNAVMRPERASTTVMQPHKEYPVRTLDDMSVLEKASNAKNGDSFTRLYRGDIGGFKSKSEADFTLTLFLA